MLRENPQVRPNIYQVLREVCLMRGTDVPIKDVSIQPQKSSTTKSSRYMLGERHQNLGVISNCPHPKHR